MKEIHPVFDGKKILKESFLIDGDEQRIPSEDQIVTQLIRFGKLDNMEAAVTLAIIYITGSRISEVIKYRYTGIKEKELEIIKKPFCFGDIKTEVRLDKDNKEITWIQFQTRVLKNFRAEEGMTLEKRKKMLELTRTKLMEVPYLPFHPLYPLLVLIEEYVDTFIKKTEDASIFEYKPFWAHSKRRLQDLAKKRLGINIHLLRHWRTKHLVENYGYTMPELMHTIKWKTPMLALRYAESRDSAVRDKQLEATRKLDY